jgi:hypothetical protein
LAVVTAGSGRKPTEGGMRGSKRFWSRRDKKYLLLVKNFDSIHIHMYMNALCYYTKNIPAISNKYLNFDIIMIAEHRGSGRNKKFTFGRKKIKHYRRKGNQLSFQNIPKMSRITI